MAKNKFPKVIYVTQDAEGEEIFEIAHRTVDSIREDEDGSKVAVYMLQEVSTLSVTKALK